jgi:hypothetical protein
MKPHRYYALLALAFILLAGLFLYHFFLQGGQTAISPDGSRYLAMARGETVDLPFNTRLVGPFVVSVIAYLFGVSVQTAFHLVTASSLLASLLLIIYLLASQGNSVTYQLGVLIAFGAELAVFYGFLPILVDGLLLLLTCLLIVALHKDKLALGLIIICLAALTKEYGVLLALPWAIHAYKKRARRGYLAAASLPVLLLTAAILLLPGQPGAYQNYQDYASTQLRYRAFWLYLDNLYNYLKLGYIQAWGAVWPVLLLSTLAIFKKYVARRAFAIEDLYYAIMMVTVPVLLTADWNRTFMILVPFASLAAISMPIAQRMRFGVPLALGGLATALSRSYYTVNFSGGTFPRFYKPAILTASIGASIWLIILSGSAASSSCKDAAQLAVKD